MDTWFIYIHLHQGSTYMVLKPKRPSLDALAIPNTAYQYSSLRSTCKDPKFEFRHTHPRTSRDHDNAFL